MNRRTIMYGLRHKHIRIEDQQLILKMNIISRVFKYEGKYFQSLAYFTKELYSFLNLIVGPLSVYVCTSNRTFLVDSCYA